MPLLNSMGALRNMTLYVTTTPMESDQWIAEFAGTSGDPQRFYCMPNSSGDVYITDGYLGVFKLASNGTKTYAKFFTLLDSTSLNCQPYVDSSGNLYVGGQWDTGRTSPVWSGSIPILIKYDSSGTILWQQGLSTTPALYSMSVLSIRTTSSGDLFVLTGYDQGTAPTPGTPGPNAVYVVFKIDPSTGAIINQRKVLKQATTATTELIIDSINSNVIVAGTDFSSPQAILIGYYDFTNTDSASVMLTQYSTSDLYSLNFGAGRTSNMATDGTYVYMIGNREISGITRTVYMKINKTTGAVSYSNALVINTASIALFGITMDNSGYIYVSGYSGGPFSGRVSITKIRCSDGAVVWSKMMGNDPYSENIGPVVWLDGYLYYCASQTSAGAGPPIHQACIKLKDDGSLPNGTYGTYWTFTSTTPTLVSYMPQTTGTTTGTNLNTTYSVYTPAGTTSNDSSGVTTYYIP